MPAPNHLALRIESRQHGIAFRTIRREMHDTVFVGDLGNQRVSRCILCRPQPVDGNNSFDVRAVDLARRKPILVGLRDDEAVGIRLRSRQIDRFIDGGGNYGPVVFVVFVVASRQCDGKTQCERPCRTNTLFSHKLLIRFEKMIRCTKYNDFFISVSFSAIF